MLWIARKLEEPIRGLVTFYGAVAAMIILPSVIDIEGIMIDRMGSNPDSLMAVVYIVVILGVLLLSGVIGYYLGLLVTLPLRIIVERHEERERERMRKLSDNYSSNTKG